jgi:hypothetical protein
VRLHLKVDYNPWTSDKITPIKVLIMAPLIMVSLPPVSSFFSREGASFEVVDLPPEILLLSLSSLWMAFWCE